MLKQRTEARDEWQHTPLESADQARFDKDAARDILKTAAQLQRVEQDTLSQAEIETLAQEMGISPRHVRRAITLSGRQGTHHKPLTRLRLSRRQKQLALFAPLLYGLYMIVLVTATWSRNDATLVGASLFVLPFVLSLWLGTQLRSKRAGAVAGIWVIGSMLCGIITGVLLHEGHTQPVRSTEWLPLLGMLIGTIASGVTGATLRQWITSRQRVHLPTGVTPSDLDR